MKVSLDIQTSIDVPAELPVLAARAPRWTTESISELGRRFGLVGEQAVAGPWTIVRDKSAALEVFHNSSSYRYERLDVDSEGRDGTVEGLDKDRAIDVANAFTDRHAPRGARLGDPVVTEQELLVSEGEGTEPTRYLSALQVSYRYGYEGVDLLGPGAKVQVTVGAGAEIVGAYRFWRDVRPGGQVSTITLDEAFERFTAGELFTELDDRTATASVTDVRLGYLTRPPTEPQGVLLPTYEFSGVLSTEALPRYEFTGYVLGGRIDDDLAKWAGRTGSLPEVPA